MSSAYMREFWSYCELIINLSTGENFPAINIGSHAFLVAGPPKTWKIPPEDVTSSQSEYTFCR